MDQTKSSTIYKRLLRYIKPLWPAFLLSALGNILYAAVDSGSTYLFKPILDKGFIDKDVQFLQLLPLIVIGLFILRGIGGFLASYFLGFMGKKVVLKFREDMFERLLKLPASFFDNTTTGQLLSKLIYNVEQVTQATGNSLTTLIRDSTLVIGLLVVMFVTSWRLTLLIFIILPPVILIVQYVSKRFRKLGTRSQDAMGNLTHIAEETIQGYREVRIFGGHKFQNQQFKKITNYTFTQEMKMVLTDSLSTPIIQFLGSLILAVVVYLAVSHDATQDHIISAGSFVTILSAMMMMLKPIKNLSKVNASIQKGIAAAESLFDLLDETLEKDSGKTKLDRPKGHVAFQDINFQYPTSKKRVLFDINLNVQPGESVAFVGRSGSGKSTMMSLLARFYEPTSGQILIDNYDIHELKLNNLRQHIALVSQHVMLFDDTIYNNIAYGRLHAKTTKEDIIAAAKSAHAWEFIETLPDGLDTIVGENGFNLSGGQRQRLAIARAILKDAPILILDEATSALDNESERAIQAALETLMQSRTTFIIAHRLSTIQKADKIIVMDAGHIKEVGTHKSLLAQNGLYTSLYNADKLLN